MNEPKKDKKEERKDTVLSSAELVGKDLLIFQKHVHVCISVCGHMCAVSRVCACVEIKRQCYRLVLAFHVV